MTVRLKADGATGKVAIYDYTTANDDPFTAPLSHVSRLYFHSDLPAIKVIDVQTGTASLAAANGNDNRISGNLYTSVGEVKTLFAHGITGTPYVEGRITSLAGSSVNIPLTGSVPIQDYGANGAGLYRWLTLGSNATNVVLNAWINANAYQDYPAINVGWEVYVTDLVL